MKSTATIFAYKNNLGMIVSPEGKFINDPFAPGQLGAVISTNEVGISKEAKDLIKKAKRDGGSFAELMLTKHEGSAIESHGKSSIGVLGMGYVHLGTEFSIGRTCNLSVLEDCTEVENDIPEDYKSFVDSVE
ncbi:hypothetical protein GW796_09660 [archaeon]|nr:hypothetical protein [archaeon]